MPSLIEAKTEIHRVHTQKYTEAYATNLDD